MLSISSTWNTAFPAQHIIASTWGEASSQLPSLSQDVALIDARRGANMFRKIKVPLLGIVENMSHYQCPACGHREHIFGHEGALRTAETMKMDVLGQV